MKIKKIEIENLKAIDHLSADIDGKHILVTGKNRRGKSTFLQSILFGLGKKEYAPPVREGEKEGDVHIWTTDGMEFESTRDAVKGITKVSVKMPGERVFDTKVSSVGAVVGEVVFDPFAFAELSKKDSGRKEQVEIVKALLTDEERETLAKYRRNIQANEEARTQTGKDLKKLEGKVALYTITQAEIDQYKQPIDVTALMKEKSEADEINQKRANVKQRLDDRNKEIEELQAKIKELTDKNTEATKWLLENPPKRVDDINSKIENSSKHNEMCSTVKSYLEERKELDKLRTAYGEEQALVETQREEYRNAIRSLDLPIPDLSFDDEQLIWNGRPVDSNVLSTSEIMHLGFMIRMAMAPNCEVVVIHRGESFDTDSMNELIDQADTYGLQLFVEKVVGDQEELKIEFLTKQ